MTIGHLISLLKCLQDFQKAPGRKVTISQGRPSAPFRKPRSLPPNSRDGTIPLKLSFAGPWWRCRKKGQVAFKKGRKGFGGKKTKEQRVGESIQSAERRMGSEN